MIFKTRSHWRALVAPALATVAVPAAAVWAAGATSRVELLAAVPHRVAAIWCAALALWAWAGLAPALRWCCSTDTLTSQSLTSRSGVLAKSSTTIPLGRVAAVNVRRTVMDRLCGSGTVEVQTAGMDSTVQLWSVPRVKQVEAAIRDAAARARDQDQDQASPSWW
jgi:membrane protein YdbS with pleckstrin-like domain